MKKDYFTDENHPNAMDQPAGTTVFDTDTYMNGKEDSLTIILTWSNYSSRQGTYDGTKTTWYFDKENKEVYLQWVSVHHLWDWEDGFTSPAALVPDSHKRIIRDLARERYGNQRFRRLNLYPYK